MNRFQYYNINILSRDYLLKTNGMNIMQVPQFSKIVVNTSLSGTHLSVSQLTNSSSKKNLLIEVRILANQFRIL